MNEDALASYIALIGQIAKITEAITEYADDHGGIDPEQVDWTHVGNATEVRDRLAAIAEFIGIEVTNS